jgi:phosphopantothenoylcysteine decarboxylase/phosphopantothenate--cysteine ligase
MKILLIITSSVGCYKALDLIREFQKKSINFEIIATENTFEFISPLLLETISHKKVYSELFDLDMEKNIGHIQLARDNTHIVVYPATANIISKFAHGQCSDLALTCMIAANKPIYIAPSMNKEMWANSLIQNNVKLLKEHGHHFIGPEDGSLACGEYGSGRLVDPGEILNQLK